MNVVLREPWTVERFLSWEDAQEGRHEFDGSCIIAMTGGSRAHQRIIFNLIRLLEERLDHAAFDAVQEMRVEAAGKIRYPDVTVCAGPVPDEIRTLHDAVVIFEVLSDDTAEVDRDAKRIDYANLPGMCRYVLLEQTRVAATILERSGNTWRESLITQGDLVLPELRIALPMADIYGGVRIARAATP